MATYFFETITDGQALRFNDDDVLVFGAVNNDRFPFSEVCILARPRLPAPPPVLGKRLLMTQTVLRRPELWQKRTRGDP
ncbi:MAG: hypothetical protein AAB582_00390 [Patescibacteria group bacterium]